MFLIWSTSRCGPTRTGTSVTEAVSILKTVKGMNSCCAARKKRKSTYRFHFDMSNWSIFLSALKSWSITVMKYLKKRVKTGRNSILTVSWILVKNEKMRTFLENRIFFQN